MVGLYSRYQHKKHCLRHKKITLTVYHRQDYFDTFNKYDSFKIHCSCGMCSRYHKTNNKGHRKRKIHGNYAPSKNWKHSDLQKILRLEQDLNDWEQEKAKRREKNVSKL